MRIKDFVRAGRLSKMATNEEYSSWLSDLVVNPCDNHYYILMQTLNNTEFEWSVPNDDNRAFEAKNLREQFCEDLNLIYEMDNYPDSVSMLELLISLAYRCESTMADQDVELKMIDWFWIFMENSGLDKFTDETFRSGWDDYICEKLLQKIIQRRYFKSGKGGFFPLKHTKKDQRQVELWYQMSEYLNENYFVGY